LSKLRLALLAATAVGAISTGTAQATPVPVCAGTTGTIVLCVIVEPGALPTVNPTGSSYTDCVVVPLGGPCKPVTVPIPTVTPGTGKPATISCGGQIGQNLCASIATD
jgi:hypothetical protein